VKFFSPTFFDDTEALIIKNNERIEKLKKYHSNLARYTAHNKEVLLKNLQNTSLFIKTLEERMNQFKTDIRLLNKYYISHNNIREHKEFLDLEREEIAQAKKSKNHKVKTPKSKHSYTSSSGFTSSKKFLLIILLLGIVFVAVVASNSSSSDSSGTSTGISNTDPPNCASSLDGKPFNSLSNGNQLKRNSTSFDGQGELTITNGTDEDAVVKMVNTVTKISVREYYIKSHNGFTIVGIPDGKYNLFFSLGRNWDTTNNKFTTCKSFSKFDDSFEYTTTSRQYMTYRVTLNPVSGGTATTSDLNENEFEKY
jgi:hypothetical protein